MISNLILISSLFLIISSIFDVLKKKRWNFSRVISHLSFGLLILFIGLNHNFSVEKDFNLKLGEVKKIDNYKFMKESFKKFPGNVYCLEDFPIQIPYSRIYNWVSDVSIPNFNTHKELFRST